MGNKVQCAGALMFGDLIGTLGVLRIRCAKWECAPFSVLSIMLASS